MPISSSLFPLQEDLSQHLEACNFAFLSWWLHSLDENSSPTDFQEQRACWNQWMIQAGLPEDQLDDYFQSMIRTLPLRGPKGGIHSFEEWMRIKGFRVTAYSCVPITSLPGGGPVRRRVQLPPEALKWKYQYLLRSWLNVFSGKREDCAWNFVKMKGSWDRMIVQDFPGHQLTSERLRVLFDEHTSKILIADVTQFPGAEDQTPFTITDSFQGWMQRRGFVFTVDGCIPVSLV